MTSKAKQKSVEAGALEVFPDFPPRDDLQNSMFLDGPAHQAALEAHLGNRETTIVLSEIPVRLTPSQQRGHRIPDLLVSFDIDRAQAVYQNGYSIRDLGKPPDFVLEVASVRTADNDVTGKREGYANFGIPEYWRFDPTGGRRYDAPIAGDRLVDGVYQPMEIVEIEPEHLHGHSDILNLDPCWDHGQLRWYDPATQQHLRTFLEEREGRMEAEARANSAEVRVQELEEELRRRERG